MEQKSIYDLLAVDVDFASVVSRIHDSTVELESIVAVQREQSEQNQRIVDQAAAMAEKLKCTAEEMKALSEVLDGKLEEMQRLAETYEDAYQAYENFKNVYDIFDSRLKALEARSAVPAETVPAPQVFEKRSEDPAAPSAVPDRSPEAAAPSCVAGPVPAARQEPSAPVPAGARKRPFVPFPNVDYDEVTSVEKLFAKYNGKIEGPVIVVRRKTYPWNGDYCMAIKAVNHGKGWGTRFAWGKVSGNRPIRADEEDYSMYRGESYWDVVEACRRQ